jgi:hypothetical protein
MAANNANRLIYGIFEVNFFNGWLLGTVPAILSNFLQIICQEEIFRVIGCPRAIRLCQIGTCVSFGQKSIIYHHISCVTALSLHAIATCLNSRQLRGTPSVFGSKSDVYGLRLCPKQRQQSNSKAPDQCKEWSTKERQKVHRWPFAQTTNWLANLFCYIWIYSPLLSTIWWRHEIYS